MTPKKIALLTDSSADLRWETAEENNIFFVPLRILCRDLRMSMLIYCE